MAVLGEQILDLLQVEDLLQYALERILSLASGAEGLLSLLQELAQAPAAGLARVLRLLLLRWLLRLHRVHGHRGVMRRGPHVRALRVRRQVMGPGRQR